MGYCLRMKVSGFWDEVKEYWMSLKNKRDFWKAWSDWIPRHRTKWNLRITWKNIWPWLCPLGRRGKTRCGRSRPMPPTGGNISYIRTGTRYRSECGGHGGKISILQLRKSLELVRCEWAGVSLGWLQCSGFSATYISSSLKWLENILVLKLVFKNLLVQCPLNMPAGSYQKVYWNSWN